MTLLTAMRMGMIAAGLGAATAAFAAPPSPTPAGTQIANTARMTLTGADAHPLVIDSNTVTIAVDTLIDAAIVADRPSVTVTAATPLPVPFTLTNPGNATATYQLGARADRDGVTITTIVVDADGDGRYDPAVDRALGAIALAAGASQRLLVLVAGAVDGATVTATATTTAAGAAVLGSGGGRATATARLVAGEGPAARLDKAQAVAAPDGSARAVSGAIVTYSMTARFARDCAAVELSDAVPDGTRFVPGSIALDERSLSDGVDADPGRLDGNVIRVTLGDMPAGAVRSIRFKAIIL